MANLFLFGFLLFAFFYDNIIAIRCMFSLKIASALPGLSQVSVNMSAFNAWSTVKSFTVRALFVSDLMLSKLAQTKCNNRQKLRLSRYGNIHKISRILGMHGWLIWLKRNHQNCFTSRNSHWTRHWVDIALRRMVSSKKLNDNMLVEE